MDGMTTEKRSGGDRRQMDHCGLHEANTEKINSISSAYTTLKWVTGIGLPVLVLMVGSVLSAGSNHLQRISHDIAVVKELMVSSQVDRAVLKQRMDVIEREIAELHTRIVIKKEAK